MKMLLLATALAVAVIDPGTSAARPLGSRSIGDAIVLGEIASEPPAPRVLADSADSLYQAARAALNRGQYARAADMFERLYHDFPQSSYAADAPYWQAFALYRRGDADDATLRDALKALDFQRTNFPKAGTRGDARSLETRIKGRLAQQGDADAAGDIAETARTAGAGCADEDGDDRVAALNALLQMSADRALPILKKVLARRDACSEVLRRKAVFLVAQHPTSETEDILTNVLRTDPDHDVREQAVFWLSQVNTDKAVTTLAEILRTSDDPEIREKAIFALSQHRSERAGELLRQTALDAKMPEELREKAIFWLGQQGSGANADFLRTLYAKLDDEDLKEKVLFSLSQSRRDENQQFLMDVATNAKESTEMRKKALFWVGQSGAPLAPLLGLYDRMTDRELKEQLIFVFSQRRETQAVDKMLAIARTEKDRDLRKKAIFWLSQSHDPRVAQFLQELIDQ